MAALALRRASSFFTSPRPSSSVLHPRFLPFSTSSAINHLALIESAVAKCDPSTNKYLPQPLLPIPDGFPFAIVDNLRLLRRDKDEKFQVDVDLNSYRIINGGPCYQMYATIDRGDCRLEFDIVAGPETLMVERVAMSAVHDHRLEHFDEFLDSKGISKALVTSVAGLFGKT